ncbi:hypothetical protein CHU92_00185 [Flavobacterium cyanobacteriorum]|uniref:DUF3667 domain-containing protein n=1 Tax=Flavobacterium cyanobacteriorum TaxID=2022802 RepID=A0A256A8J9_9FLAO|nr:DUF3667 domain-containing protein [Flavobacterium cyanobacteriorum]OYQ50026.1 hypothetical protein CHU92_00185 [Flavobacterium cyanobacteriorum]
MGNHALRNDNECQNCGYTVEVAYCSKCGQKNTETRQPFHYLITHFLEDFTHYDGAFWKTIKYLLFRPAKLTKEYLMGHRQRYVPPIKLYIFISFVTFLLLNLARKPQMNLDADFDNKQLTIGSSNEKAAKQTGKTAQNDTVANPEEKFSSVAELEHFQKNSPEEKKLDKLDYSLYKSLLQLKEGKTNEDALVEKMYHTVPKALFIYMPVFAFWLWLFHNKKRWYFFDHGIFTLHYFSLLLLLNCIFTFIGLGLRYIFTGENDSNIITFLLTLIYCIYAFFYFFRSHSRMYGEKKWVSRLKSSIFLLINFALIIIGIIFIVMKWFKLLFY